MIVCQCDICGKTISREPWRLALPKLEPIHKVIVNGKVATTFGKIWEIVNLDLCEKCMAEAGNCLSTIWREEI